MPFELNLPAGVLDGGTATQAPARKPRTDPWRVDVAEPSPDSPTLALPPQMEAEIRARGLRTAVSGMDPAMATMAFDVAEKTGINPAVAYTDPVRFRRELEATEEWKKVQQSKATLSAAQDQMFMASAQRDLGAMSDTEQRLLVAARAGAVRQYVRAQEDIDAQSWITDLPLDPDLNFFQAVGGSLFEGLKSSFRSIDEFGGAAGERGAEGVIKAITDIGYTREQALAYLDGGQPLPELAEYTGELPWAMRGLRGSMGEAGGTAEDVRAMNAAPSFFQLDRFAYKFFREVERSNKEGWGSSANADGWWGRDFVADDEFMRQVQLKGPATRFMSDTMNGVASMANMMFWSVLGAPEVGLAAMYAQIAGGDIEQGRAEGRDIFVNWRAANFDAMLQTPMEALSLGKALAVWQPKKYLGRRMRAALESMLTEGATEAVQAIPERLARDMRRADAESVWEAKDFMGDLATSEFLRNAGYQGAIGAVSAGLIGGVGVARSGYVYMRNKERLDQIDVLTEQLANLKDTGSSPAVLQRFAASLVKQGRLPENVFIPAGAVQALFQNGAVQEMEKFVTETMGMSMDEFNSVAQMGGEVQVPGDRLGPMLATQEGKRLAPEIKMSPVETEAALRVERVAAAMAQGQDIEAATAAEVGAQELEAARALFQDELEDSSPFVERITADLMEKGGYTRAQAAAYAVLVDANAHIWAASTGSAVSAYYGTFGYRMQKTDFGRALDQVFREHGPALGVRKWDDFVAFYNRDEGFRAQVNGLLRLAGSEQAQPVQPGPGALDALRGVATGLGLNPDEIVKAVSDLAGQGRAAMSQALGEDITSAIEQALGGAVETFFPGGRTEGMAEPEKKPQTGPGMEEAPLFQAATAGADMNNPAEVADAQKQWAEKGVESPYFKKWGRNAPIIKAGEEYEGGPIVVEAAHGTSAPIDFEKFKLRTGDIGIHFGTPGQANDRISYVNSRKGAENTTPRILPVYLRFNNLLRLADAGSWNIDNLGYQLKKLFPNDEARIKRLKSTKDIREFVQSKGYDGVVYKNDGEVDGAQQYQDAQDAAMTKLQEVMKEKYGKPRNGFTVEDQQTPEYKAYSAAYEAQRKFRSDNAKDSYIVFAPTQIKSAFNRGTFDASDSRILYQVMSSRTPYSKNPTEDALAEVLTLDWDVTKGDTRSMAKNMDAVAKYPNTRKLTGKGAKSPARRAEAFIDHVVSNLLYLHDAMPDELRRRAKLWYDGGNRIVRSWSGRYGISDMQGAAVIAVLSPQKDWFQNVTQAERVLDIYHSRQDFAWTPEMDETATRIAGSDPAKMDMARGSTLGQLLDRPDIAARWVRVFDETYNDRSYRVLSPEGGGAAWATTRSGGYSTSAWGSYLEIAKAASVIADGRPENVHLQLGTNHKVRNFYNNLFDPSQGGFVTIDTHAVAAALMRPLSGNSVEAQQNFGEEGSASSSRSGLRGTYSVYAEAYRRAAEARGLLPREMQSITWEAVRGLFERAQKAHLSDKVNAIWERYKRGEIEQGEAQRLVTHIANGMSSPAWSGSDYNDTPGRTYSPRPGVSFEVAPSPDNLGLSRAWQKVPLGEQLDITREVAAQVVPRVLEELGVGGILSDTLGGYMGQTTASMSLTLTDPGKTIEVAKALGHVLSQQSMVIASEKPMPGASANGAVTIELPDGFGASEVASLYERLWELEENGERLVGGHTTANGQMVILNFTGLTSEELARRIDGVVGGEMEVVIDTVYSKFLEEKEYGYGGEDQEGAAAPGPSLVGRLHNLRAEASDLLEDSLRRRGHAFDAQRGPASRSLRTGAEESPVRYGRAVAGASSALGVHFSREQRVSLSGAYYGTGLRGVEARRVFSATDQRLHSRVHFYVDTGSGIVPERGVGRWAHRVQLDNLYDTDIDRLGVVAAAEAQGLTGADLMNAIESAALDAGFDGVFVPRAQGRQGVAVLIGPAHTSVPVEPIAGVEGPVAEQITDQELVPPGTIHPKELVWSLDARVRSMVESGQNLPGGLTLEQVLSIPRPRDGGMRELGVDVNAYADQTAPVTSLFQDKVRAPIFYSRLQAFMESRLPERAPASALLRAVESWDAKTPGFGRQKAVVRGAEVAIPGPLAEELEWSGLREWLAEQGESKVTKAQVLDYLKQNEVRLLEVRKEGLGFDADSIYDLEEGMLHLASVQDDGASRVERYTVSTDEFGAEGGARRVLNFTRHADIDSSGEESDAYWDAGMDGARLTRTEDSFGDAKRALAKAVYPLGLKYGPGSGYGESLSTPGGSEYFELLLTLPVNGRPYSSKHWDEKNVVATARAATFRDTDNLKVLLVDEVQSDWAEDLKQGKDVPAAPFVTSGRWQQLLARRLVRYAAENGFSRVAWTTGEMQAERSDLSKQVSEIAYWKDEDGYGLSALDENGAMIPKLDQSYFRPEELERVVGKELAQKILDDAGDKDPAASGFQIKHRGQGGTIGKLPDGVAVLQGGDLKVGGGGKARMYDMAMPKAFAAAVKPWVGKLTTSTIRTTDKDGAEKTVELKAVNITLDILRGVLYVGQPLFQQEQAQTPSGATTFEQDMRATIHFFESKDFSTAGHEIFHVFRRTFADMATRPDAEQWLKDDWAAACAFVGASVGEVWTVEQEEKWAEAGEQYLLEGKAPSKALQGAFSTFRRWLMNLYRAILGTGTRVSPEMRRVFDRMLATEQDMADAAGKMETAPLFEESDLGDDAQAYMKAAREAKVASTAEIEAKLEAERQKLLPEWRKQARQWADDDPGQKRLAEISQGGGLDADALAEAGLSAEAISELRSRHPGRKLVAESGQGLDPFERAKADGFGSVGEMVADIMGLMSGKNIEEFRALELEHQWQSKFDPELEVLQDRFERLLELESQVLGAATSRQSVSTKTIKAMVRERTGQTKVGRIEMSELEALKSLIRREARAAREAYRAGKKDEAMRAKDKQRRAIAELTAKWKAKLEVLEVRRKTKALAKGKNIRHEYREQMLAMIQRFGLGTPKTGPMEPDKLPTLTAFLGTIHSMFDAEMNRASDGSPGLSVDIPLAEWLLALPARANIRAEDLTLDQLRDVYKAIRWLSHQGRTIGKLLYAKEKADIEAVAQKSAETMAGLSDVKVMSDRERRTLWGKAKGLARGLMAEMRMMEHVIKMADGFSRGTDALGGVLRTYLLDPLNAARDEETIIWERIHERMRDALVPLSKERFAIPEVQLPEDVSAAWEGLWDQEKVFCVALNMGNEGNRNALKKGYSWLGRDGKLHEWTDEDLNHIVKHLPDSMWRSVEEVWALVDSVFPNVQAAHRRITGLPIKKVQAEPFVTPAGRTVRGGYYPLVFDAQFSKKARAQEERDILNSREAVLQAQNPRSGFTTERVGGTLPPKLGLGVLYRHLWDSVHYATHAVALRDGYRLVTNETFDKAFRQKFGAELGDQLIPWLRYIARPEREVGDTIDRMLDKLRAKSTVVVLGLNARTAVTQYTALTTAMTELGVGRVLKGVSYALAHPRDLVRQVDSMSPLMRARADNLDRELKSVLASEWSSQRETLKTPLGEVSWAGFHQFCFWGIRAMDAAATYTTWMSAYKKGMDDLQAQKLSDPAMLSHEAARYADDVVRQTQGHANPTGLSSFQRSENGLKRMFSMFMTFTMNFWNRQAYYVRGLREGKVGVGEFAQHFWLEWMMPTLLLDMTLNILASGFDTDEWDVPGPADFIGFWVSGIPFARNVIASWEYFGRSNVSDTPALNGLDAWSQLGYRTGSLAWDMLNSDEIDEKQYTKWVRSFLDSVGYAYGVPTKWAWTFYDGVNDMLDGETSWPGRLLFKNPNGKKEKK
jgi:hypothetical protein